MKKNGESVGDLLGQALGRVDACLGMPSQARLNTLEGFAGDFRYNNAVWRQRSIAFVERYCKASIREGKAGCGQRQS